MDHLMDTDGEMDMDDMDMDMSTPMPMDMSTPMNMSGGGGHHMMMMKMYFHGDLMERVLFDFWNVTDAPSMIYSCAIIFVLAFLYEGLKYFRDYLFARTALKRAEAAARAGYSRGSGASTAELAGKLDHESWCSGVFNTMHLVQTFLHALQFFVSYLLMLVFMTYNSWLCLAVILGAALGYFLFGWKKHSAVEITDHCQ